MTLDEIERLAALCVRAGIGGIELAEAGFSLRICLEPSAAETPMPSIEASQAKAAFKGVRAPGVGVFRHCHPATGRPVVETGSAVREGETVGVLQDGPRLRAVTAPADGVLGAALVEDGAVVGYGTPLYALL